MSTEQPLEEPDFTAIQDDRIAALGSALGLDLDFISEVQARGKAAVIDRAILDSTGALPRLMAIINAVGSWMEEAMAAGEQVDPGALPEAIGLAANEFGVPPEIGIRLVGVVIEAFQRTSGKLEQATRGGVVGELGYANSGPDATAPGAAGPQPPVGPAAAGPAVPGGPEQGGPFPG